jgi:sugar lactone lactonase YvrE
MQIECVTKTPALLGESPVWSVGEQALYWVDITGRTLHRFDPASGKDRDWPLPEEIGCVVPRRRGGLIVGLRHGIAFFDPATGALERLVDPEAGIPGNRFNDGTTDPAGRLWAGTMSMDLQVAEPMGTFYRFDPDRSCRPFFDRVFVSNGLAFSPDGRTMYLADTNAGVRMVWACDYDLDDGVPSNRRVFVDTRDLPGRPDGGSCDADGCYWMAAIDGGQIIRFTPRGVLDRVIDLPVKTPTKAAFGGPGLDTLYVTSLQRAGRSDLGADAGALLAIHGVGVAGFEITPFAA